MITTDPHLIATTSPKPQGAKTPWEETRDGRLFLAERAMDEVYLARYKRWLKERQAAKKTCPTCGRCKECG